MFVLVIYYLVFPLFFFYYKKYCTARQIGISMFVLFVIVTYTLFRTAPFAIAQSTLIRQFVVDQELETKYMALGVMSYALPHGIVPITPALCYGIKYVRDKIIRIISILLLIEIFALIFLSGATTPMLIFFLVLFVSFIYNPYRSLRANWFKLAVIAVVLLLITNESVLLFIFKLIYPLVEGTIFAAKIDEFELILAHNAAYAEDVQSRGEFFSKTINTFFNNILFGSTNGALLGGHNYFFDILASIGLVGFIPFVANLVYIIKRSYNSLSRTIKGYYIIGIGSFIFMALTKNVFGSDFFIFPFLVLPCMLLIYDSKT